MRICLWVACAVALAGCADAPTLPAEDSPQSPPLLEGAWRAHTSRGAALPAGVLLFDPVEEAGEVKSIHFVADSARLVLLAGGQYQHRVWFSEWEGPTGGSPVRVRFRFYHGDHGTWSLDGTALTFESGWIQNHRMVGSYVPEVGRLVVQHGLGTDDEVMAFSYRR